MPRSPVENAFARAVRKDGLCALFVNRARGNHYLFFALSLRDRSSHGQPDRAVREDGSPLVSSTQFGHDHLA